MYVLIVIGFVACTTKDEGKKFELSGTIKNTEAKMAYLEEMPAGGSQGSIVDSSVIDKNGKYKLQTALKESMVYNLRQGQQFYFLATVINDAPKITLDVELGKSKQYAEKYEVKGSTASTELKNFVETFNSDLQKIYVIVGKLDTLQKNNTPDSLMAPLVEEQKTIAEKIKGFAMQSFDKSNNPALLLFELGYYQTTANDDRFGLGYIDIEEVIAIVKKGLEKFPSHTGLIAIRDALQSQWAQMQQTKKEPKWIGKAAPDFSLPDVNGKEVKLSSFKGKYVLVDFWASWCGPCRAENPNVVKAYNQFKGKNFTVFGVSLDEQKSKWLEAIKSDNLSWTHASDLKHWQSQVIPLYQFDGIPYNVLIDPQGMVIAEDLKGRGLINTLETVLK
jgi:peroxiredoxin